MAESNDAIRNRAYTERLTEMALPTINQMKPLVEGVEAQFNTMMFGPQSFGMLPANVGDSVSLEQMQRMQQQALEQQMALAQQGLVTRDEVMRLVGLAKQRLPTWGEIEQAQIQAPSPTQIQIGQYAQFVKMADLLNGTRESQRAPTPKRWVWDVACEAIR